MIHHLYAVRTAPTIRQILSHHIAQPHIWQLDHLRIAVAAAGVALWAWNVDTDAFVMDEQGFDLWGVPWSETVTFEELVAHSPGRPRPCSRGIRRDTGDARPV